MKHKSVHAYAIKDIATTQKGPDLSLSINLKMLPRRKTQGTTPKSKTKMSWIIKGECNTPTLLKNVHRQVSHNMPNTNATIKNTSCLQL